jgi:hypothetical protein
MPVRNFCPTRFFKFNLVDFLWPFWWEGLKISLKNGGPTTVNLTFLSRRTNYEKSGWTKVYPDWDLQNKKKMSGISWTGKELFPFFWSKTMFWEKRKRSFGIGFFSFKFKKIVLKCYIFNMFHWTFLKRVTGAVS